MKNQVEMSQPSLLFSILSSGGLGLLQNLITKGGLIREGALIELLQ